MDKLTFVRPLVHGILRHAQDFPWQYQGFGMLRIYPYGRKTRLNVWMPSLAIPGVSLIHDHPWNFRSLIVSGVLINQRFEEVSGEPTHLSASIKPGPGGGVMRMAKEVRLSIPTVETYVAGQTYAQRYWEIHLTAPKEGTVTINERIVPKGGEDLATVYWPKGEEWVSAEPRPATAEEVKAAQEAALRWFPEEE